MTRPTSGFRLLIDALARLNIPYFVGGSVASSIHGIARATMDVDLVADLKLEQVETFVAELRGEFYADAETIKESIAAGRAFNLIHYASSYKFDIFPLRADAYSQAEFGRRVSVESSLFSQEALTFPVASAEDTVLSKLVWYQAGHEASERQWRDVLGVLRVNKDRQDVPYLREWAAKLFIQDLLERALSQA
jgi:hypothetical protein